MERRELLASLIGILGSTLGSPRLLGTPAAAQSTAPSPVNVLEFEPLARQRLSRMADDYLSQGTAAEITLRRNREAFDAIRLRPRVLVDVSRLDTRLDRFGQRLPFPILLAPTGGQRLMHSGAEPETARGALAAGAVMVVSTGASASNEEIARAAPGRLWFQRYVQRDLGRTRELVQRAEAAGCAVLCMHHRRHARDPRCAIGKSAGECATSSRVSRPPGWRPEPDLQRGPRPDRHVGTIVWVRSFAKTPVVLKGILAPEDAGQAASEGVAGVIVSNHGAQPRHDARHHRGPARGGRGRGGPDARAARRRRPKGH